MAIFKSITEKYDLKSKAFLRATLEINKNDFPVDMKKAIEKFPEKFKNYSESSREIKSEMFVIICEHFGLSHQRILDKIVAFYNISEISDIKNIVLWFNLTLPKTQEEIAKNFGLKNN